MADSPSRTLQQFFAQRDFPDAELPRVVAKFQQGTSLCARVLTSYGPRTFLFREEVPKVVRGPGQRTKTDVYRRYAIDRLLESLNHPKHRLQSLLWDVYREACGFYVEHELQSLRDLLMKVGAPIGDDTVATAFRTIGTRAEEFGVSKDHILRFYEIWPCERVENFDSLLDEWMKPDEVTQLKRQMQKLSGDAGALAKTVASLQSDVARLDQKLIAAQQKAAEDRATARSTADAAQEKLNQHIAGLNKTLETESRRLKSLEDGAATLNEKVMAGLRDAATSASLKTEVHRIESSTKSSIASAVEASRGSLERAVREELAASRASLEQQIRELQRRLSEAVDGLPASGGQALLYRSMLGGPPSRAEPTPSITSEPVFIEAWSARLREEFQVPITFAQAAAIHRSFLANRVIVCDWPIVISWLDCLEWHIYTRQLAATPLWAAEEHWADGAAHLFRNTEGPRITVIHNYDVGLVDGYLHPSLSLWHRTRPAGEHLAKLFLIPSDSEHTPSQHIAAYAFVGGSGSLPPASGLVLRDGVRPPGPQQGRVTGVAPDTARCWLPPGQHPPSIQGRVESILQRPLPTSIATNIARTAAFARAYLSDASAWELAITGNAVAWARLACGEDKAAALKTIRGPLQSVAG